MIARELHPSEADVASAKVFFNALTSYYDLSDAVALDAFARTGELTLKHYMEHVREFDAWELNPIHTATLAALRPRELRIGCSYRALEQAHTTYDLIVVDTPQGLHSDFTNSKMVEHFDFLKGMRHIMRGRCIVVLYVNLRPYNKNLVGSHGYDEYDEYNYDKWMLERGRFYGTETGHLILFSEAVSAYEAWFNILGFHVVNQLVVPCYSDVAGRAPYSFRVAFEVLVN